LFAGFFGIGMCGFGGVLPWARRMVVDQRGWLTPAEFTDMLALCQFLPGPNIVNMTMALGSRFRGPAGALSAFLGLMTAPFIIIILLGTVYQRYAAVPAVEHAFASLAAAASGLIITMAIKISTPLRGNWLGILIAFLAFAAIALLRAPLLPTLLGLIPLSILLVWKFGAQARQ
jgi:chromate transporter